MAISLLLPLLSAYTDYYVLMEADFLAAYPQFENTDLDSLLFCKKDKVTVFSGSSYAFWVAGHLTEYLPCFHYQLTFSQGSTRVLRC
jgi:hypothetical protein